MQTELVTDHVVVIDIDSLRPDHMSCYGYNRKTTPNIDKLASKGIIFENAYAVNTPCIPSRANMLTGRYGVHNRIVTHGRNGMCVNRPEYWEFEDSQDVDTREWQNLAELLYHQDIKTSAISTFPRHPAPWFMQTWNSFQQPKEPDGDMETFATPRGEEIAQEALDVICSGEESLTYVQFWDTHFPYKQEHQYSFDSNANIDYPTESQFQKHKNSDRPLNPEDRQIETYGDLHDEVDKYDSEIRYVDEQVGRIVSEVQYRGLQDSTMFIILADHGEEFGEHGVYKHHANTHDTTQRIPMIISAPNVKSQESNSLVGNIDIAPTIADLFDGDIPNMWQGKSLMPLLSDSQQRVREYIVLEHGLYTVQRSIVSDEWKLIRTYNSGGWDLDENQLYNLREDKFEQHNLANDRDTKVQSLGRIMNEWSISRNPTDSDILHQVASEGPVGYKFWKKWTD